MVELIAIVSPIHLFYYLYVLQLQCFKVRNLFRPLQQRSLIIQKISLFGPLNHRTAKKIQRNFIGLDQNTRIWREYIK